MGLTSGLMDFVGKAKWDAWKKLEGTSKEDAAQKYIELLRSVRDPSAEVGFALIGRCSSRVRTREMQTQRRAWRSLTVSAGLLSLVAVIQFLPISLRSPADI